LSWPRGDRTDSEASRNDFPVWKWFENRARRTRFDFAVLRPGTAELMRDACRRLEAVRRVNPIDTEEDIKGLDKNFLLEWSRLRAIEAYGFFLRSDALLGLKERTEALLAGGARGGGDRAYIPRRGTIQTASLCLSTVAASALKLRPPDRATPRTSPGWRRSSARRVPCPPFLGGDYSHDSFP